MDNPFSNVLTDELLAAMEELCLAARDCGIPMSTLYHGGSGTAGIPPGGCAKEKKKWLIC